PGGRRHFEMKLSKKRWACRSWSLLSAVLATALVAAVGAVGAAAATGPPTNTTRPSVTGSPVVGKVLTAHNGTWTGTAPIAFKYQWTRCSGTGTGCTAIDEAAQSQSYILTSDDLGHRLRAVVTATNSAGTSSRNSPLTAII